MSTVIPLAGVLQGVGDAARRLFGIEKERIEVDGLFAMGKLDWKKPLGLVDIQLKGDLSGEVNNFAGMSFNEISVELRVIEGACEVRIYGKVVSELPGGTPLNLG
jgi:hypothetical protein